MLMSTVAKSFHSFQRECLEVLFLVGESYATSTEVYYQHLKNSSTKVLRCVDAYLYRKPTRDQARKADHIWRIVDVELKRSHLEKMEKVRDSVVLSMISHKREGEST